MVAKSGRPDFARGEGVKRRAHPSPGFYFAATGASMRTRSFMIGAKGAPGGAS
jgi:hypothetical protein